MVLLGPRLKGKGKAPVPKQTHYRLLLSSWELGKVKRCEWLQVYARNDLGKAT